MNHFHRIRYLHFRIEHFIMRTCLDSKIIEFSSLCHTYTHTHTKSLRLKTCDSNFKSEATRKKEAMTTGDEPM